jgi:acid phosphatase family membrane protein YuiD
MPAWLTFNPCLTVSLAAWLCAQIAKAVLHTVRTRNFDFRLLVDSGGMPSSHTAIVTALDTSVGLTAGWHTPLFAVVTVFSLIVVYDATNLRRSAGYHAQVLNKIVPALLHGKILKEEFTAPRLRELLGHSYGEVLAGGVLGVLCAILLLHQMSAR